MNILQNIISEGQTLTDKAKAMWVKLHTDVKQGVTAIEDASKISMALMTAIHDVHNGTEPSILSSILNKNPEILPIIETIADVLLGPEAGKMIDLVVNLFAMGHKMSPEEEKAWFDRASFNTGQ